MKATLYLDTSALLKRYVEEAGSSVVREFFKGDYRLLSSTLTYAEMYSTFYRLRQEGIFNRSQLVSVLSQFELDWKNLGIVEYSLEIRNLIPKLIEKVYLRGADLVHFASASFLHDMDSHIQLVASDTKLLNAAKDMDFKVINPEA